MKYLIIDNRMRDIEKNLLLKLGYKLIEIEKSNNVYEEISSHVDVFCTKIKDNLIIENSQYNKLCKKVDNQKIIKGEEKVGAKYPEDIKYNVCIVGNKAIHNFKYTDKSIIKVLNKEKYELINVKQGYSKCSIAVVDEKSIIISDDGLYKQLQAQNLDILKLDYTPDIKLINNGKISNMKGFFGGAISRIEDYILVTGDLNKIDNRGKIRTFIKNKGFKIIEFKGLDVIDYGGVLQIV